MNNKLLINDTHFVSRINNIEGTVLYNYYDDPYICWRCGSVIKPEDILDRNIKKDYSDAICWCDRCNTTWCCNLRSENYVFSELRVGYEDDEIDDE